MALEHVILVTLSESSSSGYDLARRFDRSVGFYWRASHQQIYRTLASMAKKNLVRYRDVTQERRPDKKVYSVTPEGSAELRAWLGQISPPAYPQQQIAVKLRAASLGDRDLILADLTAQHDAHLERLHEYAGLEAAMLATWKNATPPDQPARDQYLVLRGGLIAEAAFLDWCAEVFAAHGYPVPQRPHIGNNVLITPTPSTLADAPSSARTLSGAS